MLPQILDVAAPRLSKQPPSKCRLLRTSSMDYVLIVFSAPPDVFSHPKKHHISRGGTPKSSSQLRTPYSSLCEHRPPTFRPSYGESGTLDASRIGGHLVGLVPGTLDTDTCSKNLSKRRCRQRDYAQEASGHTSLSRFGSLSCGTASRNNICLMKTLNWSGAET